MSVVGGAPCKGGAFQWAIGRINTAFTRVSGLRAAGVERTAVRRTNGDGVGHSKRLMIDNVSGRAAPDAGTLVVVTGFLRSDFETRRTRIC